MNEQTARRFTFWALTVVGLVTIYEMSRPARPYVVGLMLLILLGMVLWNYTKIRNQFQAIAGRG